MSVRRAEPAVRVEHVHFAYAPGGPEVLMDVTWDFPSASVTALLGPNGSGKTTLLNLILGWLHPVQGRIRVGGGEHALTPRREWSRRIGLVPQNERPAFDLALLEYVLLGRAPHLGFLARPGEQDRQAALVALDETGLRSLWDRPVNALSGGELQLATLARVLAQAPDVLLLDEPLSHLDLANQRRILHGLRSLREAGRTIILTTHDPNIAALLADEAVLLRSGAVLAGGPAVSVLTAGVLSEAYGVGVDVRTIDGRPVILPRV
jgi:iron complex transport system ATP-binding protein